MNTILHLNSSIFGEGGQSSRLASQFVAQFPGARVIQRDLSKSPLPHLDAERFGAFLSKPDARTPAQQQVLDESDALIAELKAADTIVIGLPMYNFGIPSQLKAYFDHVARAGVTASAPRPRGPAEGRGRSPSSCRPRRPTRTPGRPWCRSTRRRCRARRRPSRPAAR